MALGTATITFDIAALLGTDFDARRTKCWVTTNVPNNTLIDVDSGLIRLGDDTVTIQSDGTGSATVWTPGSDGNPTTWQTYFHFDYPRAGARDRQVRTFGPYTITADANLAELEEEQAVPPEYLTTVTTALQAFITQGQALLDQQEAISGLTGEDDAVALLINTPSSEVAGALTASTGDMIATSATPARRAVLAAAGPAAMAARGLGAALDAGATTGIAVIGDSTGNDDNEWARELVEALATEHPEYTVQEVLWSDTLQDVNGPTILQTGTAGLQYLDTSTHTVDLSLTTAESAHTPGVLDVRVKVSVASWSAPAVSIVFVARNSDAPNRSWWFYLNGGNGKLALSYSTDGTTLVTKASSVGLTTPDNTIQWVRCVYTPSTDVKFYTSADGQTWTQLGSTVANSDGALYNASTPYELGGRGTTTIGTSKIYAVDIRDGLNGKPLVPRLPALWGSSQRIHANVVGAPTLTLVNGSQPGADLAYWTTTRLANALPKYGQALAFLSLSHNELNWSGPGFAPRYAAKAADVKAALPAGVPLIYLTQNPQVAPRTADLIAGQALRRVDIIMEAVKAGTPSIDTYAEFLRVGTATTIQADGIHPTAAGSLLWRDTVRDAIGI